MKTNWFIAFIPVLWLACSSKDSKTDNATSSDSVKVFMLGKEEVAKILTLPAQLYPWERAEVYAKVEGYVHDLKVDIGTRVHKNDVLAILDAPEVNANFARAQADLQSAQSRYRTSLDNYKRTVEAAKEQGTISEGELLRIKNQMLADSSAYEAARSGAGAYAQMKNYLTIRAAFDGIVTQRSVDVGTLVGKSPKPMFVEEDLTRLRLRVAVPELYTAATLEEKSIAFSVDAWPSKKFMATLARKSNLIDEATRTELWEFEVINKEGELKSGMYANINLKVQRNDLSFVIPFSAVVTTQEKNFVIRVANGKTEWVDVRNGIVLKEKIEIFGALNEGDQLVLKANDEIKPGTSVIAKQ